MNKRQEKTIGERIKSARRSINMNQRQFAEIIEVGPNYLSRIECGSSKPSNGLLYMIAQKTRTSYEWLIGEDQDAIPLSLVCDDDNQQNDDSYATKEYTVDILRRACQNRWKIVEPEEQNSFARTDWEPDYWFRLSLEESPVKFWGFDLSDSIYNKTSFFNNNHKLNFNNFILNVLFSNNHIRNVIKYSFVVPNAEAFNLLVNKISVPIGNVSIIQLDMQNKGIVRERYLCTSVDGSSENYLFNTLSF